jgi:hypothetical protein
MGRFRVLWLGRGRLRRVQFGRKAQPLGKTGERKHKVVQFRDVDSHPYVAVSVDGKLWKYRDQGQDS